jgi:hypothetical protein
MCRGCLHDFCDFLAAQTSCADIRFLDFAIEFDFYFLQVGQKAAFVQIVRMTHIVTNHRSFAAYTAFPGHDFSPLKSIVAIAEYSEFQVTL